MSREKNRDSIKILKIIGVILFTIEYLVLFLFVSYWAIGLFIVTKNNYYTYLENRNKNIVVDDYNIYTNKSKVYMYVAYKDYDEDNDEYSATYTLRDYDDNYYYLANENEEIRLNKRNWIDELITEYETTESDRVDYLMNDVNLSSSIIKFKLENSYYLYDAGDTLGVKARYTYYDVYTVKSHNKSGITFEYFKTYSYRGDREVGLVAEPKNGEIAEVSSSSIIKNIPDRKINEETGWLIIIFSPFIIIIAIALGVFLLLLVGIPPFLYAYLTYRSFKRVNANNKLMVLGIVLFITGCGIFSYFGAKKDEENVRIINEENDKKAQENRKKQEEAQKEKKREIERKAANGTLEFKASPVPGGIVAGIGAGILGFSIDLMVISLLINYDIYNEAIKLSIFKYSTSPLTLAGLLLILGPILISSYVKKRKFYEQKIAEAKEKNQAVASEESEESEPKNVYYCKFCGNKIKEGDLFCSECGAKVDIPKINVDDESDFNLENETELEDNSSEESDDLIDDDSKLDDDNGNSLE